MNMWCGTCHRNNIANVRKPCGEDCPVFGKRFDDLAKIVLSIPDIQIKARCKHVDEEGRCLKGASSTGRCQKHCSHFERFYEVKRNGHTEHI